MLRSKQHRSIMHNVLNCSITAVFLILQNTTVSTERPGFCECRSGALECRKASLTTVPSDLCNGTVSIDLSFNNISILDKNFFDNMPGLETVVISDNNIKVVQPEVFWGLQDLRRVDMHKNIIEYINLNTFKNNPKLTVLDLSSNNLKRFQFDFNSGSALKFLNLSSNMLTFESLTHFLPISSLQVIDLSNNELESMSADILLEMLDLQQLNISGNLRLEDDCRLRTVRNLCLKRTITCVTGDEQSFRMVDNLDCETEQQPEALLSTDESDGFINNSEYSTEVLVNEGSGKEPIERTSGKEEKEFNYTKNVYNESTVIYMNVETLVGIIIGVLLCVAIVIGGVYLTCRYRRRREETPGSVSRTNSFIRLDTDDQFTGCERNSVVSRNTSENEKRARPNGSVSQRQFSYDVRNEIVRVPSVKSRVAVPYYVPEEISVPQRDLRI